MGNKGLAERMETMSDRTMKSAFGITKGDLKAMDQKRMFSGGSDAFIKEAVPEVERISGKDIGKMTSYEFPDVAMAGYDEAAPKVLEAVEKMAATSAKEDMNLVGKTFFNDLKVEAREAFSGGVTDARLNKALEAIENQESKWTAKALERDAAAVPSGAYKDMSNPHFVQQLMENAKMSPREMWDIRRAFDDEWKGFRGSTIPPEASVYRDMRGFIEKRLETFGEEVALTSGDAKIIKDYTDAKRKFQVWANLKRAAEDFEMRMGANNMVSYTGKVASALTGSIGSNIGGMLGGIPGALVGGGVGAIGGMLASTVIRDRVPFMAAGALRRASAAVKARDAIMHTQKAIETSVDSLFSGGAVKRFALTAPAVEIFGADRKQRNDNVTKVIEHFSDPNRNLSNAQQSVEHIKHDLPGTSGALAAKQMQVMSYIAQHAPRPASSGASIMPWMDYKLYNDEDIATYAKKIRAAVDPMTILHDAKQGFVSPESVAVVKDLYPEMYRKMVDRAMKAMLPPTGRGKKKGPQASLSQSVQLSILFGINYPLTDPVYLQQIHPAQQASPDGPQGQGNAPPTRSSGSVAGEMAKSVGSPTEKLGDEL
jgi:hypothetical protein